MTIEKLAETREALDKVGADSSHLTKAVRLEAEVREIITAYRSSSAIETKVIVERLVAVTGYEG